MGIGVKPFKQRGSSYAESFSRNFADCYLKTADIFESMGATVYRGNQKKKFMIVIAFSGEFPQCSDATEVAVFFKEINRQKTIVEVISLNYALAEFAAARLFAGLKE